MSGARRGLRWSLAAAIAVGTALAFWLGGGAPRHGPGDTRTIEATEPAVRAPPGDGERASSGDEAGPATWQVLLLADAGISALPQSVRVGLATISAEDRATALETGAAESEFARVQEWRALPATRLADGKVRVDARVPAADRYLLQASGEDGLRLYDADFAVDAVPTAIPPLRAAGLRVHRDPALAGDVGLLLRRRGELAEAARWRRMLAAHARLQAAFDEQPLALADARVDIAPLPPQAIEAVLLVDGIEAQTQALSLQPGQWSELRLDPLAHAVAQALSVDLRLRIVGAGDEGPIEAVAVRWQHARGERLLHSDALGEVWLRAFDRQRPQPIQLEFPLADPLPRWPAQMQLELTVDALFPAARERRVHAHTVVVEPLRWLIVQGPATALDPARSAGRPYPVHVLQRRQDAVWTDVPADFFRLVDEGLAISLAAEGEYRLAAVLQPWTLAFSELADTRRASRDGHLRVRLDASAGHACELQVLREGQPLPRAQLLAVGPLRGLPPQELVADLQGRVRLDGVNVEQLLLEVPGFEQQAIDVRGPFARVELRAQ